ncbi:hypothetical protein KAR91_07900 [Candidatus Pacearchaeota archaeon]|nr:hypothetical protein [Candidatus Pacearchaeota archaeon]
MSFSEILRDIAEENSHVFTTAEKLSLTRISDYINRIEASHAKLVEALEIDKVIFQLIFEDHTRPRKMRGNTSAKCRDSLERIEQALTEAEDVGK